MAWDPIDLSDYTGRLYATSDPDSITGNPFHDAAIFAENTRDFIEGAFGYLKRNILGDGEADALTVANQAIIDLRNFVLEFPLPESNLTRPDTDWGVDVDLNLPGVDATNFGNISGWVLGNAPKIGTLPTVGDVDIPDFEPSITGITVPPPPTYSLGTFQDPGDAPDAPDLEPYFPQTPTITLPDRPELQSLNLPPNPTITLPTLDDMVYPEIEPLNINTFIDWSEPTYSPEIWTDVKAQIQRFFAGGSGIRPEVEEAMVARGRDREDRLIRQQEAQATDEWAGRGFAAPPGMLVKRLDNIREEGMVKKLGLNREVLIKAMDEELANIRLGVQQGIVAEQLFVQIHLAAVERLFLILRLHVEWEIQRYNLIVEVFKAKFQENLIRAQVYEIQVRAALAELEIFKALVEAELAKAEINKSLVQAYTAEIQARESLVNLYKTQIEAVKVRAEVFESQIRAYGEEVEAFGTRVNAEKIKFDAYESQVRGEVAKTDIIRAEAQAYSSQVEGIATGVRAETAVLEGYVAGFRAEVEAYEAQLRSLIGKNQVELSRIQANVAGYQADTQRYIAATGAEEAKARLELGGAEIEGRLGIAWFEAQAQEYESRVRAILGQKDLLFKAIEAQGELGSTIAAGALAALHAGATINGSGSVSASGGDSSTFNQSWQKSCSSNTDHRINYESPGNPGDASCNF